MSSHSIAGLPWEEDQQRQGHSANDEADPESPSPAVLGCIGGDDGPSHWSDIHELSKSARLFELGFSYEQPALIPEQSRCCRYLPKWVQLHAISACAILIQDDFDLTSS
jgi:hypothetical protein